MKYTTAALSLIMLSCGSCVPRNSPDEPPTLSQPSVAKLELLDASGESAGSCTVWKASDSLAVTAGHCCEGETTTYVIRGEHGTPGGRVVPLVDNDDRDVCVLSARMRGPQLQLALQDPAVGARVWVVGFPRGYFMINAGYWAGRSENGRASFSIDATGGYSGSAVMDAKGRVVAVLTEGYLGQSVTFGPGLEHIRSALARARRTPIPEEVEELTRPDPED